MTRRDVTGNRQDAINLAKYIEDYWYKQGYTSIKVWAERQHDPHGHWAIRSTLRFKPYVEKL